MEYLDPKKQKRHRLFLWIGYSLMTLAIAAGSTILLWQAYGYGVKNGKVIQDGMVFLSSQPNPAYIYVNGVLNSLTTNTRLTIPSGTYKFELRAPGYRSWTHTIPVFGGQVVHYDYPLLFPVKLTPKSLATFSQAPEVATQSPSQQFLLVSNPDSFGSFYLYDLNQPKTPAVSITLPVGLLSTPHSTQSWQVVSWANDNQHVLLEHIVDGAPEFIELDTQNPSQSINLNRTFGINPTAVSLNNLQYDQFYFYDSSTQTLSSASLSNKSLTVVKQGVLSYKSYNANEVLFVTPSGAPSGQVAVDLDVAGKVSLVRYLPVSSNYLLNIAGYNGNSYALVGASSDNYVYIYQNPENQASSSSKIVPFRAMKISSPNYAAFAPTAQFILVESGNSFAIYDIFNDAVYHYTTSLPLDAPQTHVQWMDGDRLVYVSAGKLNVADFDDTNHQTLTNSLPQYQTFFAADYHSYFSLSSGTNGQVVLTQTSLLAS